MMPSLNMCGFLYEGPDIGGFGSNTTEDLVLRWYGTVSYTHLDVYKRQGLEGVSYTPVALLASRTTGFGTQYRILCKATVVVPVSYTHLDVYKRQFLYGGYRCEGYRRTASADQHQNQGQL